MAGTRRENPQISFVCAVMAMAAIKPPVTVGRNRHFLRQLVYFYSHVKRAEAEKTLTGEEAMTKANVPAAQIRRAAELILIRLELGHYTVAGAAGNVLEVESLAAWSAVVNELIKEGYEMVSPAEYASACELTETEVNAMIWREGSLFALIYRPGEHARCAVPLAERVDETELGPILAV